MHIEQLQLAGPVDELFKVPHSSEAEQAVLGGLLVDPRKLDELDSLVPEHFYNTSNRIIFLCIKYLSGKNIEPDVITIADRLSETGELEHAGGFVYITSLHKNTVSSANINQYAASVIDKAVQRQLLVASREVGDLVFDVELSTDDKLDQAQAVIMAVNQNSSEGIPNINTMLRNTVSDIDERFNSGDVMVGVSTGFDKIDARLKGYRKKDLIIKAARPSMGKTTMALNEVESMILSGKRVLVFSMEMPAEKLMEKMISSISGIPYTRVDTGQLEDDDWPKLSSAVSKLKDTNLHVDDRADMTPAQMRSRARKIKRQYGYIDAIYLDYLQMMKEPSAFNREREISVISGSLKSLAKEMDCPVIALSQLSRNVEQRENKRPRNSDLRDSGSIEQDADVIQFIYRDEHYNEHSNQKGIAEIITTKYRNGVLGTDCIKSELHISRFTNLSADHVYTPQTTTAPEKKGFNVNG